jgi:hypothetical protein
VQPGDDIALGPWPTTTRDPIGTLTVNLPGTLAGATQYLVDLGCNAVWAVDPAVGPSTLTVYSNCVNADGTFTAVATAYDGAYNVVGFASLLDAPAPDGPAEITLPAWRTDVASLDFVVTGAPDDASSLSVDLMPFRGTVPFIESWAMPLFGDGTVSLSYVPDTFDRAIQEMQVRLEDGGILLYHTRAPIQPSPFVIDVATMVPPRVHDVVYDVTPAEEPRAAWITDGDMTATDGASLAVEWTTPAHHYLWIVVGPPDLTSPFAFPPMPDELATLRVPPGAALVGNVGFQDASFATPDERRVTPFWTLQTVPTDYTFVSSLGQSPAP